MEPALYAVLPFLLEEQRGKRHNQDAMEIKPVIQSKQLVYPLVTAVVVGTVVLSGCQQQQQLQNEALPQVLGGVMK